jgi:hypothetical protein
MKTVTTVIGVVTVLEMPNEKNNYFYIVRSAHGTYNVSSLGGKAAEKAKVGDQFTLSIQTNNFMTFYQLTK